MVVWFTVLGLIGLTQIVGEPGVLAAIEAVDRLRGSGGADVGRVHQRREDDGVVVRLAVAGERGDIGVRVAFDATFGVVDDPDLRGAHPHRGRHRVIRVNGGLHL